MQPIRGPEPVLLPSGNICNGPLNAKSRGMIIPITVFIIGILTVFVTIFNFTSRQSKLMSRRVFWGEMTFYITESVLEECFYRIQLDSARYMPKFLAEPGSYIPLKFPIMTLKTLNTSYGLGLEADDARLEGRFIPGVEPTTLLEGDQAGILQLRVTLRVASSRSKAIVRRINASRGVRFVTITGPLAMTPYLLFLKNSKDPYNAPTPNRNSTRPQLTLVRTDSVDLDTGRIFLGGEVSQKHRVNHDPKFSDGPYFKYLEKWNIKWDEVRTINSVEEAANFKNELIASPLKPPNPILSQILDDDPRSSQMISDGDRYRWFNRYFDDFPIPAVELRIGNNYKNEAGVLNLKVESPSSLPIEGLVYQEYSFGVMGNYPPGKERIKPAMKEYDSKYQVPLAQIFETDPRPTGTLPLFRGIDAWSGKEDSARKEYLPVRFLNSYAEIYPEMGFSNPWSLFLREHSIDFGDHQRIYLNGITGIIGDINIDKATKFIGQGVILVTDRININDSIEPDSSDPDAFLMLVSRVADRYRPAINIRTNKPIHAYLQAHSFSKDSINQTGTLISNQAFNIIGGLSLDHLDVNKLPENCVVKQPLNQRKFQSLAGQRIFALQHGYHFYKIFNNEHPDHLN